MSLTQDLVDRIHHIDKNVGMMAKDIKIIFEKMNSLEEERKELVTNLQTRTTELERKYEKLEYRFNGLVKGLLIVCGLVIGAISSPHVLKEVLRIIA